MRLITMASLAGLGALRSFKKYIYIRPDECFRNYIHPYNTPDNAYPMAIKP